MKMKKAAFFAGILGLCLPLSAQTKDAILQKIDSDLSRILTDWESPGMAVAIVQDDSVIFSKGSGLLAGQIIPAVRGMSRR